MTSVYVGPVPLQPFASVAVTVMGNVPGTCGVPKSSPEGDSDNPAGSVPLAIAKLANPTAPVCVNVWLKPEATVPGGGAGFVTVMVWQTMTSVSVAPAPVPRFPSVTMPTMDGGPGGARVAGVPACA